MRPATATPSVSVIPSATPTAPIMPAVVTPTAPVGSIVPTAPVIRTAEAPGVAVGVIRVARVAVVTAKPGGTRRCAIVSAVIDHLGMSRVTRGKQKAASSG